MTDFNTFAFTEVNPITGRSFAESRFRDLPAYAADVVTNVLHMCAGEWNVEVTDGTALDWTGETDRYPVIGPSTPLPCSDDDDLTVVVIG